MRKIKYIAIHCSAGFSLIPDIERFWYKSLGWKNPGYHIIVYPDGQTWYVTKNNSYTTDVSKLDIARTTNGVLGFNDVIVNICYIGGIDKKNPSKALDTRTPEQKSSILKAIVLVQTLIKAYGQDPANIKIQGHRDFSPDKNGNGVIDSWERIKECPSFDAIPEYSYLIPKCVAKTMYTLSNLNIREGAGTNFKTVSSPIPKGDVVTVINTVPEGWSKVTVNKTGVVGWVATKYLR